MAEIHLNAMSDVELMRVLVEIDRRTKENFETYNQTRMIIDAERDMVLREMGRRVAASRLGDD